MNISHITSLFLLCITFCLTSAPPIAHAAETITENATTSCVEDVVVSDGRVFVDDGCLGVLIYDIDGNTLKKTAEYPVADDVVIHTGDEDITYVEKNVRGIAFSGNTMYIGVGFNIHIIDISNPAHPTLIAKYPIIRYEYYRLGGSVHDIVIQDQYAYIALGSQGIEVLDISNPHEPVSLDRYGSTFEMYATSLAFQGNSLYVGNQDSGITNGGGFMIFDVADRSSIAPIHTTQKVDMVGITDIQVKETSLYTTGEDGLEVYDVTQVAAPIRTAAFSEEELGTGMVYDVTIAGNQLYIGLSAYGVGVIDRTDFSSLQMSVYDTAGKAYHIASTDRYAYVADDTSGIQIYDITDASAWKHVNTVSTDSNTSEEAGSEQEEERAVYDTVPGGVVTETGIVAVTAKRKGRIQIHYADGKTKTYRVFRQANGKPQVQFFPGSTRVIALHPAGKSLVVIGAKKGRVHDRKILSQTTEYKNAQLLIKDIRGNARPEIIIKPSSDTQSTRKIFRLQKGIWKFARVTA